MVKTQEATAAKKTKKYSYKNPSFSTKMMRVIPVAVLVMFLVYRAGLIVQLTRNWF